MQVGEFNSNISANMAAVVATGEPATVTRYRRGYVTVSPAGLLDELAEAAGDRGQEILDRYRDQAEQHKQEAAA